VNLRYFLTNPLSGIKNWIHVMTLTDQGLSAGDIWPWQYTAPLTADEKKKRMIWGTVIVVGIIALVVFLNLYRTSALGGRRNPTRRRRSMSLFAKRNPRPRRRRVYRRRK
jgi:hypothetical protein